MKPEICPVPKLQKLLLSADGSEFSEGATREAISLAKKCSSKLYALSVVETNPEYESLAPQLVEKEIEKARALLTSIEERAAKEGVDCVTTVRQGEYPYSYIIQEAAKQSAEMIIMGRRGRTGLKRLVMGSVTAKVIGHAPCDVLVVPKDAKVELRKILLATDGSHYSENAAVKAIGIAKRSSAHLAVVSVVPSEGISPMDVVQPEMHRKLSVEKGQKAAECYVDGVRKMAEREGVKVAGSTPYGRPYQAITDYAIKRKIDLIVIGSHGKAGLERLLMGSVAERVIVLSPCAVLVAKTE
jgi:nucleotide-binding universal stress UspA family protein